MKRTPSDVVREIGLGLPEAEEARAHGMLDYRAAGRTFATHAVNHHGDGRIALWLPMPPGAQQFYTEREPEYFFVPPYVGPRGWLGVHLDRGLDWNRVAQRVREAYVHVVPARLAAALPPAVAVSPPTEPVDPELIDPFSNPEVASVIERLRQLCLELPETHEDRQFGNPCWRAGKKTFCTAHRHTGRLGADRQAMLTFEPRYRIPPYIGHNGWIALAAGDDVRWDEVASLVRESYRHFALKRMLKALDAG